MKSTTSLPLSGYSEESFEGHIREQSPHHSQIECGFVQNFNLYKNLQRDWNGEFQVSKEELHIQLCMQSVFFWKSKPLLSLIFALFLSTESI
jgi:hypothetical protein